MKITLKNRVYDTDKQEDRHYFRNPSKEMQKALVDKWYEDPKETLENHDTLHWAYDFALAGIEATDKIAELTEENEKLQRKVGTSSWLLHTEK